MFLQCLGGGVVISGEQVNVSVEAFPSLEDFRELATEHRVIPVSMTVMVDHLTAVGLFHALCADRAGTFLFESAEAGVQWSRYSFIGVHSHALLTEKDGVATWTGRVPEGIPLTGSGIDIITSALELVHTTGFRSDLPPLTGGMVGYLAYDIVRQWENIGRSNSDHLGIPDLAFLLATDMAVVDHLNGSVTLISNAINYDNAPERVDEAYSGALESLTSMLDAISGSHVSGAAIFPDSIALEIKAEPDFLDKVERVKEYIRAGDAFQVVLSQRFSIPCESSGFDVYRALRAANPSPYMYILRIPRSEDITRTEFE